MGRYGEQDVGDTQRTTKSYGKKRKFPALSAKDGGVLAKYKPYIKAMIDRGVKSHLELKRGMFNIDFTLTATPGNLRNVFLNLTQGVGRRMRIGNSIRIMHIYGRWAYKGAADSGSWGTQTIRSSIVRSKAGFITASIDGPLDVNGNVSIERGGWDINTVGILHDNTSYLVYNNAANPGAGNYGQIIKEEFSCFYNKVVTFEQPDTSPDPLPAENGLFFYSGAGSIAAPLNAPIVSGFIMYSYYDA